MNFSIAAGCVILFFVFSIFAVSLFLFMFHVSLTAFSFIFASLASLVFAWLCVRLLFGKERLAFFGILCVIIGSIFWNSIFLSGVFYDLTCDGQFYHQEAVIQLAQGWNPVYEELSCKGSASQYINPYAKASWICEAALYKATGHIEQGKVFNFLLIFASFFLLLASCLSLRRIRADRAVILSFLIAFNPISVSQIFSFYVDGQLASLIMSLAAVLCLVFTKPSRLADFTLLMIIALAINVKLTAIAYLLICVICFFSFLFFTSRKTIAVKIASIFFSGFLIGIFIFGYNPFITNTLKSGNPFYIAIGAQKADLMEHQRPVGFDKMNRLERLFLSLFSSAKNQERNGGPVLKWPFTVAKKELAGYAWPDLRISGFGPLFGTALVLSLLMILIFSILRLPGAGLMLSLVFLILISSWINPEAWWARFVPQLWLIPFIMIIFSFYTSEKVAPVLGKLLYFVIFANVLLVSVPYLFYQDASNRFIRKQLTCIVDWQQPVYVTFSLFRSGRIRLQENGIKYIEMEKAPCPRPLNLLGYGAQRTQVCPPRPERKRDGCDMTVIGLREN